MPALPCYGAPIPAVRAHCAPVNPTLPLAPSFLHRENAKQEGSTTRRVGTARANVARPRRCFAAAPVFRPAHLTVGQAATRPLSVPGQRWTGWPSCATTDRPGYEGAHAPRGSPRSAGMLTPARGRWCVVSARAFVPSGEQALRGRRGTLSRLRVPAGAFDHTCRRGRGVVHMQGTKHSVGKPGTSRACCMCERDPGIFHEQWCRGYSLRGCGW
jgi:hypothetical protein